MLSVKYCTKSFVLAENGEETETNFQERLSEQPYQIIHKGSAIRCLKRVLSFNIMRSLVTSLTVFCELKKDGHFDQW